MARYDMTIIGGGSGGLTAARIAGSLGARVLLVEKESLGGDCLRYGCVPSKSLIHVARVVQQARDAAKLGVTLAYVQVDMAQIARYIQGVIGRVAEAEKVYTEQVTVRFGEVTFASPRVLRMQGEDITSRTTVIATGSRPAIPSVEGLRETGFMTNMDVFDLTRLPASMIIVGGGPIGVELGQAFECLGTHVTIIQGPERILPREDPEVSAAVTEALTCEGVTIVTGARFVKASRNGDKKVVTVSQGEQLVSFEADEILLAVGRQPNVAELHLEAAGIAYDAHGITVNEFLQTSVPQVFAIGDVIGDYLFTHVATYQAKIAVRNALVPLGRKKVDYRVVPWCTFTDPEAARVGLTPDEARKQHKLVRIVKLPWADIDRAQTEGETGGFIKLVLAGKRDQLVGAHMVGTRAGELLGELALAMQHKLTLNDIFGTIHAYPTLSTGVQQVAAEAYLQGAQAASNRRIVRTLLNVRK